jgi:hypothetical protein
MNHAITHTLIGLAIMLPFAVLGYPWTGAIVASGFYGLREVYQYYILHKRLTTGDSTTKDGFP